MLIYKKLRELLSPQEQKQIPGLLLLILLGMLLETVGVGLIIPALAVMTKNDLYENHPAFQSIVLLLGAPSHSQLVMYGMLALLGLYVFKTAFVVFMLWRQNKFIYGLQSGLSSRLFRGYLLQPWSFHLQRNSAQLILNVTNEVNIFSSTTMQSAMLLLTEGFVLIGVVTLLLAVEPFGALVVIGVLGAAAFVFQRSVRAYILSLGQARQYHDGMRIQHLQQGLGGAKDVKILGREQEFLTQYNVHNQKNAYVGRRQKTLMDLPRLWLELLAVAGLVALVMVLLARGVLPTALLPTLGLFAAAAFRIIPSANRMLGALQNLRFTLPIIDVLHQEIDLLHNTDLLVPKDILSFNKALSLENVAYLYQNADQYALMNVSFSITPGKSIGFIGTSGAGKSTLVDVMLGLLPPTSGRVLVDNVDIQTNLRGWQDQIGYVPQTIFLTDDTLRRNIAFGLSDDKIDEVALKRSIKAAQLEEFVDSLSEGVNTLVGERGVRLSGGQRQRIGIARALYHDPAVLVLDEATSALDMATEKSVMEAINALHGDKTLLIIAHRLSTVANCDWIYKMEKGQIVDAGPFDKLCCSVQTEETV